MMNGKKNTASRLSRRLTLQQETRTPDTAGGYVRSWEDVVDLWAEIKPLNGKERVVGAQLQSEISHKVTIRYRAGVAAGMRLLFNGRALNIRAVINVHESNDMLELVVIEGDMG